MNRALPHRGGVHKLEFEKMVSQPKILLVDDEEAITSNLAPFWNGQASP
jgi:hypothetical protein